MLLFHERTIFPADFHFNASLIILCNPANVEQGSHPFSPYAMPSPNGNAEAVSYLLSQMVFDMVEMKAFSCIYVAN